MGGTSSHVAPLQYRGASATKRKQHPPRTDLKKWFLKVDEGRQTWTYEPENPSDSDFISQYHVGLFSEKDSNKNDDKEDEVFEESLKKGITFFSTLQTEDGHFAGDYGGPMFLLIGFAIVTYITKTPVPDSHRQEIIRYLFNTQNEDGGWGIHIESISTVFGTVLNYVAARIIGCKKDEPQMIKARDWIKNHELGIVSIPQWGKFWLAVLNIVSWDCVNSLFPEMILFPRAFPLHTYRMWSYCRTVYMPMSYLFGCRYQCPNTDEYSIVSELRDELLPDDFENMQWTQYRNTVAKEDLYTPHSTALDISFSIFNYFEYVAPTYTRKWALDLLYKIAVEKEDEFTNYICIGPVNKVMNMLITWLVKGKDSKEFKKHQDRLWDYMWMGADGMKMNGTNGSQLWDTAFLVQGLIENTVVRKEFPHIFAKANEFLDLTQIRINHPDHDKYFRDETKGGWPFSTRDMGWVVADTTGEGLKASLICKKYNYCEKPLSDERLYDAANILLSMQNATGGYATCEKTRGSKLFEYFNASEVFGEIMIDYDYVECTSSSLQALVIFHAMYPEHRTKEVTTAIEKARDFIFTLQREDGSFEGMWGICFTYGTWFAIDGLASVDLDYHNSPIMKKACDFLVKVQKEDGGWGETFMSCVDRVYRQHPESQVVNTAWAVLALLGANYPDKEIIAKGVRFLRRRQLPSGDWPQESICGVFNKNCMISYSNFKNIFPIWAISRFTEKYQKEK